MVRLALDSLVVLQNEDEQDEDDMARAIGDNFDDDTPIASANDKDEEEGEGGVQISEYEDFDSS